MVSREQIEAALRALNAAENSRPQCSPEEVSDRLDPLFAPDVEGWWNGAHTPSRAAEREGEKHAFGAMADYRRDIEHMIIDAPYGAMGWTIRGTIGGRAVVVPGSSIFEFNDEGLVRRYWGYTDLSKLAPPTE